MPVLQTHSPRELPAISHAGPPLDAMPPACRVLVVDDDELIRVYLTSVLKSAGFEVDVADSGRSALRRLHAGSYDILLTDYEMPEMDGPTLCQRVRVEFPAGSLYVLMFTVKDAREDRHEGFKSGADEYIIKGSSKSEVLEKMNAGRRIQMTQHEISRCYTESRFLPRIDPLTHARTLKYFAQQMPKEIQRARRSQQPLSVASCRIEGFEQLTRQYGYAVADETIRAVAADARHCLRARQDWFARVGEDRFMLVFPRTRFNGAERLARKLRRLASLPVMTRAGPIRCTVKIVVTACEPRDEPARWA